MCFVLVFHFRVEYTFDGGKGDKEEETATQPESEQGARDWLTQIDERGSSRINETRANFTPHHNVAVQRSIQVFFLGCVTCLWAREASHATFFCSTCPDEQNYGVVSCKILLFTQCVDCLLGKMAHRLDFLKHLHVLANEGTGNPHLSNDDKRQRCIFRCSLGIGFPAKQRVK